MRLLTALIELLEAKAENIREEAAQRFLESDKANCD